MPRALHCALLSTLLLAACGQGEPNVASGNREGILHFAIGAEPQSLDPHVLTADSDSKIARALYETLITLNPETLAVEPGGAQGWDISPDGKTYTFHLNPRARWSDGDPITAQDWLWSFRRSLHPDMGNQVAYTLYPITGAEDFAQGNTDFSAVGIKAIDDYALQMTLINPTPNFMRVLSNNPNYPVQRKTIERFGKVTDRYTGWTRPGNLVGNGAFTLEDWRMGRSVVVRKNPYYWDADHVALNGIVFHTVENRSAEEKMFRVGQLHYTDNVVLAKIPWYREQPDSPYQQAPQMGSYFLMFNTGRFPLDDTRVRQALAKSIDRKSLIDTLLLGTAIPSPALVPPDVAEGYTPPDLLDYDPVQARQLLADAGYPGGRNWPKVELLYNTSEDHRKIAVALQQMWKQVLGIKVTLTNQEWQVFLNTVDVGNYQIARLGWIGGTADPTDMLEIYTSDNLMNMTGFSDSRYDDILLKQAPATIDQAERMELLREAETILMQQVPVLPLYAYTSKHLVQPSVSGMPANKLDIPNFKYVRLDPDAPVWKAED
ncbi:peptide ABC transporter substrate-binding protein [Haliea sp. E17]|uniref:peptide ABC transporter substrate-binding protein n=1 Tax=Haliea sp. E17 TaxID=3401576 RepID=UPI003AAD03DE